MIIKHRLLKTKIQFDIGAKIGLEALKGEFHYPADDFLPFIKIS